MIYSFHVEAEEEFLEAIEYYEEKKPGLGHDFAVEVHSAIERAVTLPEAWPLIEKEIRRTLVRRFPYGVLYAKEKQGVYILAIMHLHRDPENWKHRI